MMKEKLYAYIRLMRMERPVGTLLLSWGSLWGLWLAGKGHPPAKIVFIILLGTWAMRSAGCAINDFADRKFDGSVARTHHRPLATGDLTAKEALLATGLMLGVSFILVLFLNWQSILLSFICAGLTIVYPFCKRFLPTPQAVLGIAFACAILVGHTAILGRITLPAVFLFLANALWALVYDTYYALVDREDDIPLKLHSAAIFSQGFELRFIAMMAVAMLVCLLLTGVTAHLSGWYYLGVLSAGLLLGYELYFCRNLEPERCFSAFVHNNWVGGAILTGLVLQFLP